MTPKEKALELYWKYKEICKNWQDAKGCALIAVDEILSIACPDTFACKSYDGDFYSDQDYFIAVKREIEKL